MVPAEWAAGWLGLFIGLYIMAWIESHQSLGRHPKLVRLAGKLRIHKAQAIGHLHYLWWWALDYAPKGNVSAFTPAEISAGAEWPGEPGLFHDALRDGWIDTDGMIHDWWFYAGKLLEQREKDRERKREYRRISNVHGMSDGHPVDGGQTADVPTQPTNQTKPDPPPPPRGGGRKKRKPSPAFNAAQLASAERIYAHYPRKIAHKAAIKAICAALADVGSRGEPDPENYLLIRTRRYADQRKAQHAKDPDSMRFTPHPASWFNAGRYDDEPESSLGPDQWIEENGFVARNPTDEDIRRAMGGDE